MSRQVPDVINFLTFNSHIEKGAKCKSDCVKYKNTILTHPWIAAFELLCAFLVFVAHKSGHP